MFTYVGMGRHKSFAIDQAIQVIPNLLQEGVGAISTAQLVGRIICIALVRLNMAEGGAQGVGDKSRILSVRVVREPLVYHGGVTRTVL